MKIILNQDIASLGYKNDLVEVKNGYGRNFLIPKGMASLATKSAIKMLEETLRQRAKKEEGLKEDALKMAKELKKKTFTIATKVGAQGKIFGSINSIQLAEVIEKKGFSINRKSITITDEPIKELGTHKAEIKLHREVEFSIDFEVVGEDAEK